MKHNNIELPDWYNGTEYLRFYQYGLTNFWAEVADRFDFLKQSLALDPVTDFDVLNGVKFTDFLKSNKLKLSQQDINKYFYENRKFMKYKDDVKKPKILKPKDSLRNTNVKLATFSTLNDYNPKYFLEKLSNDEKKLFQLQMSLVSLEGTMHDPIHFSTELEIESLLRKNIKDYYNTPLFELDHLIPNEQLDPFPQCLLNVSLIAPIPVLENEFKSIIDELKLKLNRKQSFITDTRISLWESHKILEYFDLIIWYHLNDIKVTDYIIGSLMFEDLDIDPTSQIQKHTKKYTNIVINYNWINAVFSQINSFEKDYT